VVKRLWGFSKVRYRGLAKNATRASTALALANIYLARGPLMARVRPWARQAGRRVCKPRTADHIPIQIARLKYHLDPLVPRDSKKYALLQRIPNPSFKRTGVRPAA